jgi:N-methylhydantoinase A/oxoprolinase/acetone carboxylase beta subunit
VESVAVCLLFSFLHPAHEQTIRRVVRDAFPGLPISLSSEILPEYREYERTATTVINQGCSVLESIAIRLPCGSLMGQIILQG